MKKTILILMIFLAACSEPTESENYPKYNPPSDHTVNEDGVRHKPGLQDPLKNCVSCHGQDLKGGSVGVSCYECHGKKW
ncbi:MAG TPA: hypothetical protein ENK44_16910 [Caldithrix abyssi]|uniref:Cytochrome c7-like domain-containing protein n=1 Tax=Caldithrix abyssi TaxID=187145 RepID=A0A7V4WXA4_CALAY|nr:hypothetical protein [Caldithrix abyssi]